MPDHTSSLPARPSLEQLRKQAKELLRNYLAGHMEAVERFRAVGTRLADPGAAGNATLTDAQFVIAREYEFESWARLKQHIEALPNPKLESIEFYECSRITNAGVALLACLPRPSEITVGGSPNVTREGMAVFPATVRANYW